MRGGKEARLPKAVEILLLIAVPLAWGLASDYLFKLILGRRKLGGEAEEGR